MNLPVMNVSEAIPYYLKMDFQVVAKFTKPIHSVILSRDSIQIGLSENGGDPTQDGCFFEVEELETLHRDFLAKGINASPELRTEKHGEKDWRVFFVVAPDGLCYCFGQPSA